MDFFSAVQPIQHKNQACFMTPQLKTNNFSNNFNNFKDKSSPSMSNTIDLINQLSQQNQTDQTMKNLVQKSPSLENQEQQLRPPLQPQIQLTSVNQQQTNNVNSCNQATDQFYERLNNNHLLNYDQTIHIKQESDISNESNNSIDQNRIDCNNFNFSSLQFKKTNLNYNPNEINYNPNNQNGFTNLGVNLNYGLNGLNGINNINGLTALSSLSGGINGLGGLNNLNSLNNLNNINNLKNLNGDLKQVAAVVNKRSGRRPINLKDDKLTPEEEERRRVRRERNKEAAARCRKRRVEHTNNLEKETQELETKKHFLEQELQKFKLQSEQLFLILQNHDCKLSHPSSFKTESF